jgi:hypothetical protein
MKFDPELLYAAAMFHDIGLTPSFGENHLRFEGDGVLMSLKSRKAATCFGRLS